MFYGRTNPNVYELKWYRSVRKGRRRKPKTNFLRNVRRARKKTYRKVTIIFRNICNVRDILYYSRRNVFIVHIGRIYDVQSRNDNFKTCD